MCRLQLNGRRADAPSERVVYLSDDLLAEAVEKSRTEAVSPTVSIF